MEPFKNLIDDRAVADIGARLHEVDPSFHTKRFVGAATDGLHALELKARVLHVSEALRRALPSGWPEALEMLVASLPAPLPDADEVSGGFGLWPVLTCVERYGLDHPHLSLDALGEMTRRFSAEFAVRPFLEQHPEATWRKVEQWVTHPDLHVRRLCSEGTRPRLPWGIRLRSSVADPERGLAIIDGLVDDPELYVRRSVANHLNDVAKDHPDRVVEVATRWLRGQPSRERRWVVKHGLRTLVKQGHEDALAALGFGPPRLEVISVSTKPKRAAIGTQISFRAEVVAGDNQEWVVDWVVRAPRADGSLGRRVVKGRPVTVEKGARSRLEQRLSLKPVTTRVTRPGRWAVTLQINGVALGDAEFHVTGPAV